MSDISEEEQKVIDEFRKLDEEQQEKLIANLGLQAVKTTMEILFPEEVSSDEEQ